MKNFYTTIFCLSLFALHAQEKTVEFTLDDDFNIRDYDVTDNGNFFILENGRALHKTRLTLLDEDLNEVYKFHGEDRMSEEDFVAVSHTGKNLIFRNKGLVQNKNYYRLNKNELSVFSEKSPNRSTDDDFYFQCQTRMSEDRLRFVNDKDVVVIKKTEDKDVYLYVKGLSGSYEHKIGLNFQGDIEFKRPGLLYFNNDIFVMVLVYKPEDSSRKYLCLTYDYRGNMLNEAKLDFKVNDSEKEEFAVLHLNRHSFGSYTQGGAESSYRPRTALAYQVPEEDARGAVVYDPSEKAYYAYAGIRPNKGDSGFLICKYNHIGNLIWKKYHEVPGTVFRYANSYNRYLTFDVTPHFLGISAYSTRGKEYCNFYILNKEEGRIINYKNFDSYKLQMFSNQYAGLYSKFSSGDKGYKNIEFDRFTVFSSLYDDSFSSFINDINTETLLKSYPTAYGINVISVQKKAKTLTFQKFAF